MTDDKDFFKPAAVGSTDELAAAATIVSYGAGTNSTAILVGLWERGERPDAITFADTGGEKPHTYRHLQEVREWCARIGFPDIETLRGDMPQQIIDVTLEAECMRLGKLPAKAYGFSSCSDKWKMEPQRRYNRRFAEARGIELQQITRLIGFDADEDYRVERARKTEHLRKVKERYPLVEWGWGRDECIEAIKRAGITQPGKSACFFCPSMKKGEVLALRTDYPDLLARALEMERRALAGEGPSPQTTAAGLGRSWNWSEFLREWDATEEAERDFLKRQLDMFSPEQCDACIG